MCGPFLHATQPIGGPNLRAFFNKRLIMKPDFHSHLFRYAIWAAILGACLFVILTGNYSADTQKWAMGVVGMILGTQIRSLT